MNPFDLITVPLKGTCLIEASAGTGKTYAITGLFVRLLLERGLSVDQILVVTFTNAATEELKIRIRNRLMAARTKMLTGKTDDPFIEALFNQNREFRSGYQNLENGLRNFDQAGIYTIHGFCQKLIQENAFETGSHFDTSLKTDPVEMLQELADDFWRKHFHSGPLEWVTAGMDKVKGPQTFLNLLMKANNPDLKIVPKVKESELTELDAYRDTLLKLRHMWPLSRKKAIQLLIDPALSGTHYGSFNPDPNRPHITKRDRRIADMVEAMDWLETGDGIGFPLFKNFEKFTTRILTRATKKNQLTPTDPFFDLCNDLYESHDRLNAQIDARILFIKTKLLSFAGKELPRRKKEQNIQFYDDLLNTVRNAIFSHGGRFLKQAVNRKYKAALVDEFQDTDPVQYQIFSNLFSPPKSTLFMIGDPKQAIYGFRGADVFSYMKAARDSEKQYTLSKNYRSAPGLMAAVNTIFSNVPSPFLFEKIPFEKGEPNRLLEQPLQLDGPPFHLWYLGKEKEKAVNKTEAVDRITQRVKDEIIDLLNKKQPRVSAKEIAVLVRTNRQARIMKTCLSENQIPAVLFSTENVFDSPEAMEIEQILQAISEPAGERLIKAALITDMLGYCSHDLAQLDRAPNDWDEIFFRFREYHEMWRNEGFIRMFRRFAEREGIKQRLLGYPDGERRVTNVFHIMEILHQESLQRFRGTHGLIKWLGEQRHPETVRLDEHQLRLESDEKAVTIITMHKCKGLEYPIVFCPFGWEGSIVQKDAVFFHEKEEGAQLTLDLDVATRPRNRHLAEREILAENLRILYVALTRAKVRCYLVWGNIKGSETSAMAYLFHSKKAIKGSDPQILSNLKQLVARKTETEQIQDMEALVRRSKGTIAFKPLPKARETLLSTVEKKSKTLSHRKFSNQIRSPWKISSFSALISQKTADIELPDFDPDFEPIENSHDAQDIFSFPKGSRPGQFFHHLFETLHFRLPAHQQKKLIDRKLSEFGFSLDWEPVVATMANHVLQTPLLDHPEPVVLSEISSKDRVHEMEFYFPLNRITPDALNQVFSRYGSGGHISNYPEQLGKLGFSPVKGYMKGFIDLVCRFHGKYFLIDWKSNFLGSQITDYGQKELTQVMNRDHYLLQYHLYVLAFHQYLKLRVPSYCYQNDFGGVFYLFIRGIDPKHGSKYGVFYDLPDGSLIEALGRLMMPSFTG